LARPIYNWKQCSKGDARRPPRRDYALGKEVPPGQGHRYDGPLGGASSSAPAGEEGYCNALGCKRALGDDQVSLRADPAGTRQSKERWQWRRRQGLVAEDEEEKVGAGLLGE